MSAICAVACTGHKDTHTFTSGGASFSGWVGVCGTLVHRSAQCVCLNHYCMCRWKSDYTGEPVCRRPPVFFFSFFVCPCMCVTAATVGYWAWSVCFSAGTVRPLLLNICQQHINSSTLTRPSLPRDHLIEIQNDFFFSSNKDKLENVHQIENKLCQKPCFYTFKIP